MFYNTIMNRKNDSFPRIIPFSKKFRFKEVITSKIINFQGI